MPCPKTDGRPASLALTSSWCMGLKSPDAPAYITRSVRVSSWLTWGPVSPSLTSSKNSFRSAMLPLLPNPDVAVNFGVGSGPMSVSQPAFEHLAVGIARQGVDQLDQF